MSRKKKDENIEIKYIFSDNYRTFKKYINISEKGEFILSKKLMENEIASESCYRMLIYALAETSEFLNYSQLRKRQKITSNRHNDIKDIMLTSALAKIFDVKEKEKDKNQNRNEIEEALKNPKLILELGWKYLFHEEENVDNLDEEEICDATWLALDKVLTAIYDNKKEIFLTKWEKEGIREDLFWDVEDYETVSWLDKRRRAKMVSVSDKDKRVIYEKIKNLLAEKKEESKSIKIRSLEKGEELKISEYLSVIFGGLAAHKVTLPVLPNLNIRASKTGFSKKMTLELNEDEEKILAFLEQHKDFANEFQNNVDKKDFVNKYYRFGKMLLNRIEIREEVCSKPEKLHNDKYKLRYINYYLMEQLFAFELFEYEIKCLNDIFLDIFKDKKKENALNMKKIIRKSMYLFEVFSDIYEFPYVFMRKKIAEEIIKGYYKVYNDKREVRRWYRKTKRNIARKRKGLEQMEKNFISGLLYRREYSINDMWDMLDVDIMSWYECKQKEFFSQKKQGVSGKLSDILENHNLLIAKWVIVNSLRKTWEIEKSL